MSLRRPMVSGTFIPVNQTMAPILIHLSLEDTRIPPQNIRSTPSRIYPSVSSSWVLSSSTFPGTGNTKIRTREFSGFLEATLLDGYDQEPFVRLSFRHSPKTPSDQFRWR